MVLPMGASRVARIDLQAASDPARAATVCATSRDSQRVRPPIVEGFAAHWGSASRSWLRSWDNPANRPRPGPAVLRCPPDCWAKNHNASHSQLLPPVSWTSSVHSPGLYTNHLFASENSGPTVVDLFCGCGGLTLGLVAAGFRSTLAIDRWSAALETFRQNIGDHVRQSDLTSSPRLPECDVIVGGPPCQGFSSAGLRDDGDTRNSLVRDFASIIAECKPKAFIFENVEGFLTAGNGEYLRDLLAPTIAAGYWIHLRKVNAANFGVPQHRKRVIAVGGLGFDPGFPAFTHQAFGAPGAGLAKVGCEPARTVGGTIFDLPKASTSVPGVPTDHWFRPLVGEDLTRARLLEPGQTMRDLPEALWHRSYRRRALRRVKDGTPTEKRGGPPAGVRRLRADEPSKAITGGSLHDFLHPSEDRPLTLRETARLQTFPDRFEFAGSRAERIQMVGNSVPPRLAESVGRFLLGRLPERSKRPTERGELITFVPTLSSGMSPSLEAASQLVVREFGATFSEAPTLGL